MFCDTPQRNIKKGGMSVPAGRQEARAAVAVARARRKGTDLDDGRERATEELLVLVVHGQAQEELRLSAVDGLAEAVPLPGRKSGVSQAREPSAACKGKGPAAHAPGVEVGRRGRKRKGPTHLVKSSGSSAAPQKGVSSALRGPTSPAQTQRNATH